MPEDALNISLYKESLFLETKDGYITKETYTIENMKNVTAFLYGSYNLNKHEYKKRVPIEAIEPVRAAAWNKSKQEDHRYLLEEIDCDHVVHITFYDDEEETKDFQYVGDKWLDDIPNENRSCILSLIAYIRAKRGLTYDFDPSAFGYHFKDE